MAAADYKNSPTGSLPGAGQRAKVVMIDRSGFRDLEPAVSSSTKVRPVSGPQVDIEELYPSIEAGSYELSQALSLLQAASVQVQQATDLMQNGDPIGADLAIQRLYGILPELFNCRGLGDGFGALVNAVSCSLENLNGAPMNPSQLDAVGRILSLIRREPYIEFSIATDHVGLLEEVGLSIEPAGFEFLADWLDGESVR